MERLATTNGNESNSTGNAKETKNVSTNFIGEYISKLLKSSDKTEGEPLVDVTGIGNKIFLNIKVLEKGKEVGEEIGITAGIENNNGAFQVKDLKIDAGFLTRKYLEFKMKPELDKIEGKLKEVTEKEEGKKVEKMEIVNGELKVTFTTPKPVEKIVEPPPEPKVVVPETVTPEPKTVTPEVPPTPRNIDGTSALDQTVYEDETAYDEKEAKVAELKQKIKKIYKAGVVDVSALAKAQARDVADHRMTESKEDRSKNWLKRTAGRIWKHNIAQEWYRNREIERVRKEILESGNLYAGATPDANIRDYEKAKQAIVERFTSEYEDEMLKKEEKESKKSITDEKAKEDIKNLIKEFAGDLSMSEAAFKEEQSRILAHSNPEYAEKGKMYASNLLDIAKEIRNAVVHGEKLVEMDFDVEITLGQARESLNTEAKNNSFEKIQNSKLGKYLFNEPAAVAIAAGLYSAGNFLGVKALQSKIAKWGTFGATALVAGGIAASKEAARLNRERAQHMRESAKGMEFEEDDMKRRKEMEENRYETRSAHEIIQNLERDLAKISTGKINEADLDAVLVNLSDLEARIKLGDEKKLDLVTYSKFSEVEKERMTLDLYRAKIKVAVRKGIIDGRIEFAKEGDFDTYLQKLVDIQSGESGDFSKDIEQKNKLFKTMKRKKVAGVFVKTVLIGGAAGVAFQEIRSAFQSETDGIVEGAINYFKGEGGSMASKTTALEGLHRYIAGVEASRLPFGNGHEMMLGNTHLQLPEGVSINPNEDGTYDILRGEDVISNHTNLEFAPNGDLTDESKALLTKENIVTEFSQTGIDSNTTEKVTRSAQEYVNKHPELTKKIEREWMDNDTKMYRDSSGRLLGADKNELKLEWGGNNGTGIDENKNYVFNVEHMTNDGSFHKGLSVAAQEQLKAGKLELLLSVTKGLQQTVFKVPIDINGNAVIDPNTPIGQMMFETKNGRAIFNGQFAEIGHSTGMAEDGAEKMRILSTHVGTGRPGEVIDTVTNTKSVPTPNIKFDVPADWTPEVPPFIPIPYRRPLERNESPIIASTYDESYLDRDSMYEDPTYMDSISTYEDSTYTESQEAVMKYIDEIKSYLENNTTYVDATYTEKTNAILGSIAKIKNFLEKNATYMDATYTESQEAVMKYIDEIKSYLNNASTYEDSTYTESQEAVMKYIDEIKSYLENNIQYKERKKILDQKNVDTSINEMRGYLDKNADLRLIEELNAQIGEPMSNEAKMSVILPCYKEGNSVYKTLSDWTIKQKDLNPKELEIIIFVNAPKKGVEFDKKTVSEILRFKKDHPGYKVRLVKHNFDFKSGVKMGAVYKAPADLAIYRNMKRLENGASKEIVAGQLLRAGGADALGRNPRFLRETIDFMDTHQETEQLRTQSAYPPEVREKFPLFNLVTVFNHSLSHLYTRGKSNIGLGTFRARAYAEASGFDANRSSREEIDLGIRIREKVGKKKNAINKIVKKNAIDNPRRELFALAKGDKVLNAYAGFSTPERETALREFDWNKDLPNNFKKNIELSVKNMNREFDAYFQHYLKKVTRESGLISQIIKGELDPKSKNLHPEARLLLKDKKIALFVKEIAKERAVGKKISRDSTEAKQIAQYITMQLFDRILRTSFGFKKGAKGEYNYTQTAGKNPRIVFEQKAVEKIKEASKKKWQNFDGYWDKTEKKEKKN